MRAVVIAEPGRFALQELPDPTPAADQVVVAPDGCGVCGTDLHILHGDLPFTHYPIVPGHEFSGEVVAVGRDVDTVRVGVVAIVESWTALAALLGGDAGVATELQSVGGS